VTDSHHDAAVPRHVGGCRFATLGRIVRLAHRPKALLAGAAFAGLGLGLAGCGASPFAAIVNGSHISQSHLFRELKSLRDNAAFVTEYNASAAQSQRAPVLTTGTATPTYSQSFVAVVLGTDVQSQVVHNEVQRRQVEPGDAQITAAKQATGLQFGTDPSTRKPIFDGFDPWFQRLFEQRQAETDALRKVLGAKSVDPAAVQAFYDTMPQLFVTNRCVSHILVKTQAEAAAVRAQLVAAGDFATLARQRSTDAGSAPKGGDLGCSPPGQYPAAFEQAANTIAIGQLSQPVGVGGAFDILRVTRRDLAPLTDQLRAAIRQRLQTQNDTPLNQFFQDSAKTLKVQVNPAYGSWDTKQLTVVPPPSPNPATSGLPTPGGPATIPGAGQPPAGQPPAGQSPAGQPPAGQGQGTTGGQSPSATPSSAP